MGPKKPGDPDIFFPEKGMTELGNQAIKVCFGCPVRRQCDEYKEATGTEHGIWAAKFSKRKNKTREQGES